MRRTKGPGTAAVVGDTSAWPQNTPEPMSPEEWQRWLLRSDNKHKGPLVLYPKLRANWEETGFLDADGYVTALALTWYEDVLQRPGQERLEVLPTKSERELYQRGYRLRGEQWTKIEGASPAKKGHVPVAR